jgi:hypothetical protein
LLLHQHLLASVHDPTDDQARWHEAAVALFANRQRQLEGAGLAHHAVDGEAVVAGYSRALAAILSKPELRVADLCEVHGLLGVPGGGAWRTCSVAVQGEMWGETVFPSPAAVPEAIAQLLHELLALLARPSVPLAAKAAWAAYHLVRVHPFADGNGRLSRLVLNWVLAWGGMPFTLVVGASLQQRAEYIYAMKGEGRHSDGSEEEASRGLSAVVEAGLRAAWAEVELLCGEAEDARRCAICLEVVPGDEEPVACCGKLFHRDCMHRWRATATTCPCCRALLAGAGGQTRGLPLAAHTPEGHGLDDVWHLGHGGTYSFI